MRHHILISLSGMLVLAAVALASPSARAQGYGNPNMDFGPQFWQNLRNFDQQFWQNLNYLQTQNAMAGNQIWQYHLRTNGPRLMAQYRQLKAQGYPVTFEQFAYWDLMTAGGTNIQGAIDAQQRQIEGLRRANETQRSGWDSYIRAQGANSDGAANAAGRFSTQGIRGVSPYVDTQTGATEMLPHYTTPGQVLNSGGNYYFQDQLGTYHRWTGSSWVPMQPGR
jgi:hypothetical protein